MRCQLATSTRLRNGFRAMIVPVPDTSRISILDSEHQTEVLEFLATKPVHTVVMTSFILDNGITSELNRGTFYGYRDSAGKLEGVALIGHCTLVEARSQDSLKALAVAARSASTPIHLIMASGATSSAFWTYLHGGTKVPSKICTELLFEVGFPFPVLPCEYELRPARPEELLPIAIAQAEIAEIESGVDPMIRDRRGFLQRVMRRIEQKRIFVVFDGDELVFKADIIAETDSVAYLEGVYVAPELRGEGIGPKCLSRLCLDLLRRVQNVCLLSNVDFKGAHRSFLKAGMRNTDACTTLFV